MAIYYNTTFPSTSIQYSSSSSSSSQWPAPALDHSVSLLLPWNSICNSHLFSFSSGFNIIMSDMDRSSSEDNISVGSQEETNAEYKMDFSQDEEDLITRLYNLLGQRWALIAGRIPGRTAKEIEKYCSRRYGSE